MDNDISSALAFGALLRENPEAARIYDSCTPQQKQQLLLQIQSIPIEGIASFVSQLSSV
ncbi:hypothetical protein QVN85_14120 [Oscillibacter valericigenes]|uniref:hypothetical protein n=1 Tax=Oscillibacter ruminantium TaxID=1263547 RepID=UPI0002F3483D|nr:hypothetical protein [Oscillibacter ruminantium]MDN0034022.1 hypothetical protein [Oscillibacter valericigenes]MEA5042934.1 hypothetical protein [Oscillibacter ruminantium]